MLNRKHYKLLELLEKESPNKKIPKKIPMKHEQHCFLYASELLSVTVYTNHVQPTMQPVFCLSCISPAFHVLYANVF